jgi:SGNH domain (fused to AT3 domains)
MRRTTLAALAIVLAAAAVVSRAAAQGPAPADIPCFGAAARAVDHPPCDDRLAFSAQPAPADAPLVPNVACTPVEQDDLVGVCAFGVEAERASATFALVGDSHAAQWRGALAEVARARGWRGLSLTRDGCPLSSALKNTAEPARSLCTRWNQEVLQWLAVHPEVRTVFTGQLASRRGVIPANGEREMTSAIAGYAGAWSAIPTSVTRIVVIRDSPRANSHTLPCVAAVLAAGRRTAGACGLRRHRFLVPDAAVLAARRLASPRVRAVDLTRYFCGPRRCYPVVGGVLVYRDAQHLTSLFSQTLGPFLLRHLDAFDHSRRRR